MNESSEMYLETILKIQQSKGSVRSCDIVGERDYSKSSVSRAVHILENKGLIVISDGYINFTTLGHEMATKIYNRHKILHKFLMQIGVDEITAESDACKIEHVISECTLNALEKLIK